MERTTTSHGTDHPVYCSLLGQILKVIQGYVNVYTGWSVPQMRLNSKIGLKVFRKDNNNVMIQNSGFDRDTNNSELTFAL